MSQMKEFYEKVAKDAALQEKFARILAEGEKAGKEATEQKMLAFAKDAGYSLSIAEMQDFFQKLQKNPEGELSDMELDMVAGGKSDKGGWHIAESVLTFGISCAIASIDQAIFNPGGCGAYFK